MSIGEKGLCDNSVFGKLQEELLDAYIAKLYRSLFVLASALYFDYLADAETLMLDNAALA